MRSTAMMLNKLTLVGILAAAIVSGQQQQEHHPQRIRSYDSKNYNNNNFNSNNNNNNNERELDSQSPINVPDATDYKTRSTTFIPIIRFDKEQGNDGSYKAAWETGNNIFAQEEGFTKVLGPDPDAEGQNLIAQVQQGSYTYTSPEGQIITVNYIADEKGFHATGDHLPTPPPVSEEVQKGLDLIFAGIRAQQEADAKETQQSQGGNNNNQYSADGGDRREIDPNHNGQYFRHNERR